MVESGELWGDEAQWYPDVVAAGDASRAWQAEFNLLGIPVLVRPCEIENWHRAATAGDGERQANLLLNPWKRQFRLALRIGRYNRLQGDVVDLAPAAAAAGLWLSGQRGGRVAAAWPFLGSVALAEARERDDRREGGWLWLHENHCATAQAKRLSGFIALAFHEPRLRALRPFTSHWTLCFSDTDGMPSSGRYPQVIPARVRGRYVVRMRDGALSDAIDPAAALRLVLADLPH